MNLVALIWYCLIFGFLAIRSQGYKSTWMWSCDKQTKTCFQVFASDSENLSHGTGGGVPLEKDLSACFKTCSPDGLLWSLPTISHVLSPSPAFFRDVEAVNISRVDMDATTDAHAREYFQQVFMPGLKKMRRRTSDVVFVEDEHEHENEGVRARQVLIDLTSESAFTDLLPDTDESYSLSVSSVHGHVDVSVVAKTYYGLRHGLETLSQLIAWNGRQGAFQLPEYADIVDAPKYSHRGVFVDTARSAGDFIPIPDFERIIDGLSHNKLNVLHWRINGFYRNSLILPSESTQQDDFFNDHESVYTADEVVDLVNYAVFRGVRINPVLDVFDTLYHCLLKEGFATMEEAFSASVEGPESIWCGINPLDPTTFAELRIIFEDIVALFPSQEFHLDFPRLKVTESLLECWSSQPQTRLWLLQEQGRQESDKEVLHRFWDLFVQNVVQALDESVGTRRGCGTCQKTITTWSDLQMGNATSSLLAEREIVQISRHNERMLEQKQINRGFEVILSLAESFM